MLSAQQFTLYYLYALYDLCCKDMPRHIDGTPIFLSSPCGASGHECFYVYEWCKHQYRSQEFWADTKLPSRITFLRLLKTYGIGKRDTWAVLRAKIPSRGHAHMLSVRRHCNDLMDEIRCQLKRYRHNKALAVGYRMKLLNESKDSQNRPIQGDTL